MSPAKKPTKPIDIYVRVSVVGGRDVEAEGGTAAEQERRCRAYLEAKSLTAGKVYTDLDVSGGKMSRPAFDLVVERAKTGASGGMIAINLKRFARRAKAADLFIELEREYGVAVIAIEDDLDTTTPMGRAMIRIVATFAELELDNLTEGWVGVKHRAYERGCYTGTPAGYARENDGTLRENGTADTVREAFTLRAGGGSWTRVAELLGVTVAGARAVITNPVYRGEHSCTCGCGESVVREGWALVGKRVWDAAQPRMNGRTGRGPGSGTSLLSGLLRCAGCRSLLQANSTVADGKRYGFYRCQNAGCTERASVGAVGAEEYLVSEALGRFAGRVDRPEVDLVPLEAAVDRARERKDAAVLVLDATDASEAARLKVLREELAAAEDVLAAAEGQGGTTYYSETAVQDAFASGDPAQRQQVLRELLPGGAVVRKGRGLPIEEKVIA